MQVSTQYLKTMGGLIFGILLIWIGVTGRLGSLLGAFVTPDFMVDGNAPGVGSQGLESTDPNANPITPGSTLTMEQIGALAYNAGILTQNNLTIAIAIAQAESSGVVNATHKNGDGSTDYGLWQINSVHKQFSASQLVSSASYNATAMVVVSGGGANWLPWTTYTSGIYRQFVNQANVAAMQVLQANAGK